MAQVFEDTNRLVVLRSGLNQPDGALLRSLLEAKGVPSFLANEQVAGIHPGFSANLMVRYGDLGRARQVLDNVATLPACAFPVRHDPDGEELACARCGSSRVHPFQGTLPSSLPFFKVTAKPGEGWFHCLQCDSYYNDRRPRFSSLSLALIWGGTLAFATLIVIWLINCIRWL